MNDDEAPGFEEALAELERIVKDLEDGELPIDDAIARFEAGLRLLRGCRSRLESAELRVRELLQEAAGGTPEEP